MRAMAGSVWPGLVTAAVPVGRCLMVSGWMTNSRVRVRVPAPLGALAPRKVSVRSVVGPGPARPDDARDGLGRGRDDLAVGDERGDVAEDLVGERRVVGRTQIGELLRSQQQAEPRGAAAAEEPHDAARRYRGELVD